MEDVSTGLTMWDQINLMDTDLAWDHMFTMQPKYPILVNLGNALQGYVLDKHLQPNLKVLF